MSKGNLIHTSHAKLNSAIELLDRLGVTYANFDALKKASSWQQQVIAAVLAGDQYLLKLLSLEVQAKKAGFSAEEISKLAGNEELLRSFHDVLLGNAEIRMPKFWRTLEDLHIRIPALKRPTLCDLRKRFDWIKKIESDASPTYALTLQIGTVLRSDEDSVVGMEYERRCGLREGWLGYQQAVWLVDHQDEFPILMAILGKVYVDFPGLVVVRADGDHKFPCLKRNGGRWYLYWDWAGGGLGRDGRVASK